MSSTKTRYRIEVTNIATGLVMWWGGSYATRAAAEAQVAKVAERNAGVCTYRVVPTIRGKEV